MIINPPHNPIHTPNAPHPNLKHKNIAHRNPDQPVGYEIRQHGRLGVACATQSSGRDRLQAIEQLECGRHQQQLGTGANHNRIGREQARNQSWEWKRTPGPSKS